MATASAALDRNIRRCWVSTGGDDINIWGPVLDEPPALVRLAVQGIGVMAGTPFEVLQEKGGHLLVTVATATSEVEELA
ncbi:hypothetical protein E8P82_07820 [Arthrobacter echini]|uniref:Uncharacterized protein n=1 Tax=Arthrobacter echini TaxID=1529066 RepID=A0A4S5E5K9_9MICC|nr:hypothetical protein [Arthrobacter echini]THJ66825.1 hypothetical protein E8P82_07820 [Arthrobacter echini]